MHGILQVTLEEAEEFLDKTKNIFEDYVQIVEEKQDFETIFDALLAFSEALDLHLDTFINEHVEAVH